ncbi:right-handed parallel beta-helix repeat-containing protein [Candidatus Pacearchaeota archaeon]|nr:right-handed parallel beta-helix repeat-containing protein [Candidatus Pacearchaeota archaeon]
MTSKNIFLLFWILAGILAVLLLLDTFSLVSASTPGDVSTCQTLDTAGNYTMTQNLNRSLVNSTGCFLINASNVELNCRSFIIANSTLNRPAINVTHANNVTIRNCNLSMALTTGYGLNLLNVTNSRIINITVNKTGYGIYIQNSSNITFLKINASQDNYSFYFLGSHNNTMYNITTSSAGKILLNSSTQNNFSSMQSPLISLISSSNNFFTNRDANNTGDILSPSSLDSIILDSASAYNIFAKFLVINDINDSGHNNNFTDLTIANLAFSTDFFNINDTMINLTVSSPGMNVGSNNNLYNISGYVSLDSNNLLDTLIREQGSSLLSVTGNHNRVISVISDGNLDLTNQYNNSFTNLSLGRVNLDSSDNNTFTSLTVASLQVGAGLSVVNSKNNVFQYVTADFGDTTAYPPIYLQGSSNNTIAHCTIGSSGEGSGRSIGSYSDGMGSFELSGSGNNRIQNCSITTAGRNTFGVLVIDNSNNNNFSSMFISNLEHLGFYIEDSSNITLSSSIITNNSEGGVYLNNTSGNILFNNTIIGGNEGFDTALQVLNLNSSNQLSITDGYVESYSFSGVGGFVNFKNTQYGEIRFLQPINESADNLTDDIKIENDKVTVNDNRLGLNQSANVTFYGLPTNFDAPLIFKNNIACNATYCYNFTSLNAGTVIFNVTGWSNYRVGVISTDPNVPIPNSGGGGGSGDFAKSTPILLKLLLPNPLSTEKNKKIILPITLANRGALDLRGIVVRATVSKDGALRKDLLASFDNSFLNILPIGASKNITLIVDVNTEEDGVYEILLNATVQNPAYQDSGKILLTVGQGTKIQDKVLLTDALIAQNPECLEIKETLDEAKSLIAQGKSEEGDAKLDEAVESCKRAISQRSNITGKSILSQNAFFVWVGGAVMGTLVIGAGFYFYQRWRFRKFQQFADSSEKGL